VGLSPRTERPSHRVAEYLQQAGFRIVPVRPGAERILGEPAWPDLGAAAQHAGPLDIVNVFRRSETIPDLLEALLALRPRLVWLQVGVRHEPAAARLEAADIPVVMDRCLMVDHSWLVNP
ncbi:MAG TPA: CoA-binding protein, partial [Gemmatimonadales bacterium]|nr:CoA-binding protein [Gemmatimonadales bacterium]